MGHMTSDGKPFMFRDLPQECFPVKITAFLDGPGGEILWERVIEPYVAIEIPGAGENAGRVHIRAEFATGEVEWA